MKKKPSLDDGSAKSPGVSDASQSVGAHQSEPETAPASRSSSANNPEQASSKAGRRQNLMKRASIPALVLLLAAAGLGYWLLVVRTADVAGQNQDLIRTVSRLAVVPKDEVPSVTTVVDTNKVNQEFLRSAQKGDKVLLYFQEGRAVVYRPSTKQIVNMGPLETPKPRVFLRDGTGTSNLDAMADRVAATNEYLFASRDSSPVRNYAKTVVVDLTGNRPDVAQRLARLLGVSVVTLPESEGKPDGDVLVIVGKDAVQPAPANATEGSQDSGAASETTQP